MKNHLALIGILATACTGDSGKDSGTTDTAAGDCAAEDFYNGPVTIDTFTVDCSGGEVTFAAETIGWTDGGFVFTQETGNESTSGQWSDEHTLVSREYDACGGWDHLDRTINVGVDINDWQENVSSIFTCEGHYNDPNVVTYAVYVVDIDGNFADCVVDGEDPSGLIAGTEERAADPSFDESDCTPGTLTM